MVLGTLPGIAVGVILTVVNALIFCLDAIAVAIAVNSSRITTDTARLPVCPIKVEEAICENDLEQYWLGMFMQAGSYTEEIKIGRAHV